VRAALATLVVAAALVASTASAARAPWYAAADGHCRTAIRDGKRLVATIVRVEDEADAIRFLRDGVAIQARLLERLRAAGPPRGDADVARFLSLLRRSVALDRRSVDRLAVEFDHDAIDAWVQEGKRVEARARLAAQRAGLRDCARYLDPATYK
jgi:hypothetical protein